MNTNTALMERKAKAVKAHVTGDSPTLPPGVKRASHQGIQRHVFVDARNGWVFKVEKNFGVGCNNSEYQNYLKGKDSEKFREPYNYRLPLTMLVGDVIVMEYVKGSHADYDQWGYGNEDSKIINEVLGLSDLHWQNVIVTKEKLIYPVDMAF